jgi:hypothetical protein
MDDRPSLQGEEGSINGNPVEVSDFFPPPEIGMGNWAAVLQQLAEHGNANRGDPQRHATQQIVGRCLIFGYAHMQLDISCN